MVEKVRIEYASGLYSNTEILLKYVKVLGVEKVIGILNYNYEPTIREDLKDLILAMPSVHIKLEKYYQELSIIADTNVNDTFSSTKELDEAISTQKAKLKDALYKDLGDSVVQLLPIDFMSRFYRG